MIKSYVEFFFFPASLLVVAILIFLFSVPSFSRRWSERFLPSVLLFLAIGPLIGAFVFLAIAPHSVAPGWTLPNSAFLVVYQGFFFVLVLILGAYGYFPSALIAGIIYGLLMEMTFQSWSIKFLNNPVFYIPFSLVFGAGVGIFGGLIEAVTHYGNWPAIYPISGTAGAVCGLITTQYLLSTRKKAEPPNQSLKPTPPSGGAA